jgi:hypothetical protein
MAETMDVQPEEGTLGRVYPPLNAADTALGGRAVQTRIACVINLFDGIHDRPSFCIG